MSMLRDEKDRPLSSDAGHVEPSTISLLPQEAGVPSYPPTEVQRWLICPTFRDYSARWEPRFEPWTPNKLVGSSIHAGIAAYLEAVRTGASLAPPVLETACEVLRNGYVQQETWGLAGLEALVKKGLMALIKSVTEHLLPGAQIIGVETAIKAGGRHRILDLTLQRGETLEVWDWKVSLNLSDTYLPDRLLEAHHSWQLLDYAYHGAKFFGRDIQRVGQGLVILGPKLKVEYSPVAVTPERLNQWQDDAVMLWTQMAWMDSPRIMGEVKRWHNWQACTDKHLFYGKRCPMWEGCHAFYGNEALFPALYRPISEEEPK